MPSILSRRRRRADGFIWGGIEFADEELEPHFMIMGATRSGKTLSIRMLLKSALFDSRGKLAKRALIYDPKRDFYPVLRGMGVPASQIRVLHPLDQRCVAWDVATDINDPVSVRQLAATLCPPEKNDANRYFTDAARDILTAVINTLRKVCVPLGTKWVFNDIVEATSSPTRLLAVLKKDVSGIDAIQTHLDKNDRTAANVLSTLRSRIANYENVGALWVDRDSMSLGEWLEDEAPSVLLLPSDEKHRESLDPINQAVFRRATELVLSRPEKPDKEVWFVLDELRLARQLTGLEDLLLKGRSKGARCVLGFQNIEGLHDVYGEKSADDLLGQCGNKAFLRADSPQCMQWASRYFADVEYMKKSRSRSETFSFQSGHSHTESESTTLAQKAAVMPIQFREFQTADRRRGIDGAFVVPSFRCWIGTVPAKYVARHVGQPSDRPADAGFIPRPPGDQERRMWREGDYDRLDLPRLDAANRVAREGSGGIQEMDG